MGWEGEGVKKWGDVVYEFSHDGQLLHFMFKTWSALYVQWKGQIRLHHSSDSILKQFICSIALAVAEKTKIAIIAEE